MNDSKTYDALYDVAIIGLAGRFPGAQSVEQFWQNLKEGVESISFFSDQELAALGVDAATLSNPNYVKAGGVLEGAEWFDANFFSFTPNEAASTDPQQRLFLECAVHALETAGYAPSTYAGRIGVYAGVSQNGYLLSLFSTTIPQPLSNFQLMLGNDKDYLATRVSYKLNLRGPAFTVQTACSTSLVAIHLAYQSLLNHECDIALAGGASIVLPQNAGYLYQEGGLFSPDGHVRAFDAQGRGLVNGNGVCLVALKRLTEALADGDYIYAVIKGSAINNDGSNKVGYTAPSVSGQAAVIAEALAAAQVEPDTITYVETHGTGTQLGDPVEISALTQAFRARTQKKNFCAIGSVKTNIGHLSSAAGAASLIKTALALHHKQIPPSLHFQQPNPRIDFADSPFYVNTRLRDWETNGSLRRAGVSSFGLGGTNVHVILEEAPAPTPSGPARPWQLLLLSAKTDTALETAASNLAEHLQQHPELNLADVAYTLQVGRDAFSHRLMLVCRDQGDAVAALETLDSARVIRAVQEFNDRPVVFMFPGGGAQYVNMGRELYETEPAFRALIDRGAEYLKPRLKLDLRDWMYPAADKVEEAAQQLERTRLGLPALFMTEYALAQLWIKWGICPQAMIGHSLGEYAAACLAGVFSFEEALDLVALRGELFERLPEGAMLSVPLSEADMQPLLGQHLSLAAVNGAALCVASGPVEAIAALQETLAAQSVPARRVHISVAAHSEMVTPILGEFLRFVEKLRLQPPQIPYLSNVTGTWIIADEATDPDYWARHLRQTVRFTQGIEELLQEPGWILLEVGPGQTLTRLVQMRPDREPDQVILSSMRHPEDKQSDVTCLLNRLGQLWLAGQSVDWTGFHARGLAQRQRIPLPAYPFERQRYWIDPLKQAAVRTSSGQVSLGKKPDLADWCYLPVWKQTPPVQPVEKTNGSEAKARWLLFVDTCGLGTQLTKQLEQAGHSVITVVAGEGFARLSESAYALNPKERDDYAALIRDLQMSSRLPHRLVHLWGVAFDEPSAASRARLEQCHELGYYSVLFLVQSLSVAQTAGALELAIVSSNMQPVTGAEALCPEKATLLGMSKVIPQEYPNMACRSIDLDWSAANGWHLSQLAARLCVELTAKDLDPIVAYRGNRRWVPGFEAVRLDDQGASRLRERGVYFINGGLGNVGFVMAEYLARTAQARLALVGRTPLPPREEWEQWLSVHDAQDRISTKINKVRALEGLGAEVLALTADVTNLEQMRDAVAQTQARFGALHGVIHSAIEGKLINLIQGTTRAECERNLAPKVDALFVLEEVLRGLPLDFCLLQSSIASVLGGVGYVVYAASNTFTDAFAWYHNQTDPVPWLSVNWDIWKVGEFQTHVEQSPALGKALRPFAMTAEEGVEAFRRVLGLDAAQVIISTGSLSGRMDQWLTAHAAKESERAPKGGRAALHPRPHLRNEYVAPCNELEEAMAAIWQKQLGIERVGIHDNFFELGGDSLLAIQFIPLVSRTFQVDVNVQKLLETPTVAGTAAAVAEALQVQAAQSEAKAAQLLDELEHLSDDEVRKLLAEEQAK